MSKSSINPDMSTGDSGGGKSRAAMKRAKKKERSLIATATIALKGSVDDDSNDHSSGAGVADVAGTFASGVAGRKRQKVCEKESSPSHIIAKLFDMSRSVVDAGIQSHNTPVFCVDSSEHTVSTLPDASLVEILLLDEVKNEEVKRTLQTMTAKRRAAFLFQTMIHPTSLKEFYEDYWEKKPLLVRASDANKLRYRDLLSLKGIKTMTEQHAMYYGIDLNVTKFQKGSDGVQRRITLDRLSEVDGAGKQSSDNAVLVNAPELWSDYDDGCTIRLLCPQKHNEAVHTLLSTLEMEFQCMVGANAYLTPPRSSQGFAPHYDDIEAFCLQLQGSKRWKVYEPTLELPRSSSEDFTLKDLEGMKPILDTTLGEGDILYMPRGWIHQACTLKDGNEHSLHLTVSAMQQWAWADLMEMVLPEALQAAATSESCASLRQGLPRGFMDYMGVMHEETKTDMLPDSLKKFIEKEATENAREQQKADFREQFRAEAKKKIMAVAIAAIDMIDASCDQMAKRFISERQPPALTPSEAALTSRGDAVADEKSILPNTKCRLVRPGVARLVLEDNKAVVYHCADNSREYLGNPINPLEFEMDDGPALEQLLTTIEPNWMHVNDLFHDSIEDKISITQALYDEGILCVKQADDEAALR